MESYWSSIFILFEDGLWVGYFETAKHNGTEYCAARHLFGPEPSDAELREFVLQDGTTRLQWTAELVNKPRSSVPKSPKRRVRDAAKAVQNISGASQAREAVKADIACRKIDGAKLRKLFREENNDILFAKRQEKRKNKHRGH